MLKGVRGLLRGLRELLKGVRGLLRGVQGLLGESLGSVYLLPGPHPTLTCVWSCCQATRLASSPTSSCSNRASTSGATAAGLTAGGHSREDADWKPGVY